MSKSFNDHKKYKLGDKYNYLISEEDTNYKKSSYLTFNPESKQSKFKENSFELNKNQSMDVLDNKNINKNYLKNLD